MNKRVLNYLGLVSYMYSDHAIKTGDLAHAGTFLKVFKMADPKNPDCGYLSATYYMQAGDQNAAIASLNESVSLGFNEVAKLLSDPAFSGLHDDARFKKVVDKARENYSFLANTAISLSFYCPSHRVSLPQGPGIPLEEGCTCRTGHAGLS